MIFRDLDLDFDIFDADSAEAYEQAVGRVQEATRARPENETLSKAIRRQCKEVFDFFDDLFGDGFHKQLFGERTNLLACVDAFVEFSEAISAQRDALVERTASIASSGSNRSLKWAAKK